jgi:hypothetical protein
MGRQVIFAVHNDGQEAFPQNFPRGIRWKGGTGNGKAFVSYGKEKC